MWLPPLKKTVSPLSYRWAHSSISFTHTHTHTRTHTHTHTRTHKHTHTHSHSHSHSHIHSHTHTHMRCSRYSTENDIKIIRQEKETMCVPHCVMQVRLLRVSMSRCYDMNIWCTENQSNFKTNHKLVVIFMQRISFSTTL